MRVLHLVDTVDAVGGVQTYLGTLLPLLADAGIESAVAADSPGELAGVRVRAVPGLDADGPVLAADAATALDRVLRETAPDVVFSHLGTPGAVVRASAAAPVVVYPHDYGPVCPGSARYLHRSQAFCAEGPGLRCFWRAYTERTTNRRPDRLLRAYRRVRGWRAAWDAAAQVVVASPFARDLLVADGVDAAPIVVVGYPVAPRAQAPREVTVDVLSSGRLVASKGIHVLLDALAQLPDVSALVAGDGPDRAALEAAAVRLGIADRVRFVGWVGAVDRDTLLRSARVFAMPSLWDEAFGIAGVEAFAAGTPVVATRVGGIPSWLIEGEAGLLVDRGDAEGLAEALRRVLEDEEVAAGLAARAPAAAARFAPERHLELLLPVLRDAAA